MYSETEGTLVFKLFKILVNMTESSREEIMQYQKELFDDFELNDCGNGMDIRLPTSVSEMKEFITEGTHSILKTFWCRRFLRLKDMLVCR